MSKVMLVIPVGIGVAAAIFAAVYFGANEPESGDFTISELVTLGSPYLGDESAPITIIEFGDYQCTVTNFTKTA